MRTPFKALTATTLAASLILVAAIAQARTMPPLGRSHPANSVNEDCMRYDNAASAGNNRFGLHNNCAGAQVVHFPLAVDDAQAFTVIVSMRDSGVGAINCTTRVRDAFGNLVLFGSDDTAFSTAADGDEQLTIVSDGVPFGGTLLLSCTVSGGANLAKIYAIDWF